MVICILVSDLDKLWRHFCAW